MWSSSTSMVSLMPHGYRKPVAEKDNGSLVPRPRPAFHRLQYGFSVLQAIESWAGPGNEAMFMGHQLKW